MEEKLDKQTRKVLKEGRELRNVVKSDGWQVIRRKLVKKIVDLGDIMTFDTSKANLATTLEANKLACSILLEFLADVEGDANRIQNIEKSFREEQEGMYLHIVGD